MFSFGAKSLANLAGVHPTLVEITKHAIGDRSDFLSAGAWKLAHRIGELTSMSGTGVPATGGALAFQNGDVINLLAPAFPGYRGVMRVSGTWRDWGAVA